MNKLKFHYFINMFMLVVFIVTALSGLIVLFFLPRGFPQAGQQLFLFMTRRNWVEIHEWAGIITIILVFVHVILHWNWVAQATKSLFKNHGKNDADAAL